MADIQAIQTRYRGYNFRSRLEARWAVFFDALGMAWEYEPEGFVVGEQVRGVGRGWRYLPDFFLPASGTWVEVKGSPDQMDDDYLRMLICTVDFGGNLPGVADSWDTPRGILMLGQLPPLDARQPALPIIQHKAGVYINSAHIWAHEGKAGVSTIATDSVQLDAFASNPAEIREAMRHAAFEDPTPMYGETSELYRSAIVAARSARFEFGESGAT